MQDGKLTRRVAQTFLALLFSIGAPCVIGQADQSATAWGDSVNGIQMALSLDPRQNSTSELPQVNIAFRNVAASGIKVALGGGCGHHNATNSVILLLTDDQGNSHELRDMKGQWFCAGVDSVNLITLAPGGYYSTSLDLHNYFTFPGQQEQAWHMAEPTGLCLLRAAIVLPLNMTVTSNDLRVQFHRS